MTADLETLLVAAYVFAEALPTPCRPGRPAAVTDGELIALAVSQAATGVCSDRQFLGLVGRLLPGWFPRLADGTLVGVADYAGCAGRSEFAGVAAYGYCAAKSRYYWGMRLVLLCDRRGLPLGYTLVAANEREHEPVRELTAGQPHGTLLIADKGLWGRGCAETLRLQGIVIRTPDRTRTAANRERERALARLRLVIESVFANLKCQMRLEQHLAKTPDGLVQRLAQRLLALTLGMFLNALAGRPPRSLVAYEGR